MFLKIIAAAAVMAAPAVAHAQATTPTVTQDTTHATTTRIRTDSTKVDTANGSVYTKRNQKTIKDSTTVNRMHTDSTMNVSPLDSTRMGVPSSRPSKTPPR